MLLLFMEVDCPIGGDDFCNSEEAYEELMLRKYRFSKNIAIILVIISFMQLFFVPIIAKTNAVFLFFLTPIIGVVFCLRAARFWNKYMDC